MKHLLLASLTVAVSAAAVPGAHAENPRYSQSAAVIGTQGPEQRLIWGGAVSISDARNMPETSDSSASETGQVDGIGNPANEQNPPLAWAGNATDEEALPADRLGDIGPKPDLERQ